MDGVSLAPLVVGLLLSVLQFTSDAVAEDEEKCYIEAELLEGDWETHAVDVISDYDSAMPAEQVEAYRRAQRTRQTCRSVELRHDAVDWDASDQILRFDLGREGIFYAQQKRRGRHTGHARAWSGDLLGSRGLGAVLISEDSVSASLAIAIYNGPRTAVQILPVHNGYVMCRVVFPPFVCDTQ